MICGIVLEVIVKILGRTQPLERYPVLRSLEVIKRLGFDGVEVCLETAEMAPDTLTPERLDSARAYRGLWSSSLFSRLSQGLYL